VVAPALNKSASASCVFPVPPWPTIATFLKRPISSTAIADYLSIDFDLSHQKSRQSVQPAAVAPTSLNETASNLFSVILGQPKDLAAKRFVQP
jgi:hypothetical protein